MFDSADNDYVMIASVIHTTGRAIREMFSAARQLDAAAAQAIHLHSRMMTIEIGIDQRDIQQLTFASTLAIE